MKNYTAINPADDKPKCIAWSQLARPTLAEVISAAIKEFPGKDFSELQFRDFFTIAEVPPGPMPDHDRKLRVVK